jgi:hypothetical protein
MDIAALKKKHQQGIEILEAMETFNRRIKSTQDSLNGFGGQFEWLRKKYTHNIEIYEKCVERLYQRYMKLITV